MSAYGLKPAARIAAIVVAMALVAAALAPIAFVAARVAA